MLYHLQRFIQVTFGGIVCGTLSYSTLNKLDTPNLVETHPYDDGTNDMFCML